MWNVNKLVTKGGGSLKLSHFGNRNIPANFFVSTSTFRPRPINFENIQEAVDPLQESLFNDYVTDNETELLPAFTSFLFELPGMWSSPDLQEVEGIDELFAETYYQDGTSTYVVSENSNLSFTGITSYEVTDDTYFGFFNYEVTKIVVEGLNLDFVQTDGYIQIVNSSKSCRARIGDTAVISFTTNLGDFDLNKKELLFFSKETLNIAVVTYFSYEGKEFLLNFDLNSSDLINTSNNSFFIVK